MTCTTQENLLIFEHEYKMQVLRILNLPGAVGS